MSTPRAGLPFPKPITDGPALRVSPDNVHQAVRGRHKVLDAVEAAGILELADVVPYVDEVVAVLSALSPAHNETILRALETALNEGESATPSSGSLPTPSVWRWPASAAAS